MKNKLPTAGVIFDMDGTLVDSRLDFDAMRAEMQLPVGLPILESLQQLDPQRKAACEVILDRHEREGAEQATLIPGVAEILTKFSSLSLKMGIVTRNNRAMTDFTLERLEIAHYFSPTITRECGPEKPDPWSILHICETWDLAPAEVVMVGDFHFDLITANNAGCPGVLYTGKKEPSEIENHHLADHFVSCFTQIEPWLAWLAE